VHHLKVLAQVAAPFEHFLADVTLHGLLGV
jgi:hypothetical protein